MDFLQVERLKINCRKKEKGRDQSNYPYKVIEITPPPKSLGVRCLPHVSLKPFCQNDSVPP